MSKLPYVVVTIAGGLGVCRASITVCVEGGPRRVDALQREGDKSWQASGAIAHDAPARVPARVARAHALEGDGAAATASELGRVLALGPRRTPIAVEPGGTVGRGRCGLRFWDGWGKRHKSGRRRGTPKLAVVAMVGVVAGTDAVVADVPVAAARRFAAVQAVCVQVAGRVDAGRDITGHTVDTSSKRRPRRIPSREAVAVSNVGGISSAVTKRSAVILAAGARPTESATRWRRNFCRDRGWIACWE